MTDNTPDTLDNVDPETTQDWRSGTALDGDASFDKFNSVDELGKSYREMEKYSSGALRVPSDDASDEAREDFLSRLSNVDGVMRTPDGYAPPPEAAEGYKFNDVEGFTGDESIGELKTAAQALGMTNAQADGIHKFLATNVVAGQKSAEDQSKAGFEQLKGSWGAAYDQKMQGVENAINTLSQKLPWLKDAERTPELVTLIDVFGGILGEAGAVNQDPRTAMTVDEASQRLADLSEKYANLEEGDMGWDNYRARAIELRKQGARLQRMDKDY